MTRTPTGWPARCSTGGSLTRVRTSSVTPVQPDPAPRRRGSVHGQPAPPAHGDPACCRGGRPETRSFQGSRAVQRPDCGLAAVGQRSGPACDHCERPERLTESSYLSGLRTAPGCDRIWSLRACAFLGGLDRALRPPDEDEGWVKRRRLSRAPPGVGRGRTLPLPAQRPRAPEMVWRFPGRWCLPPAGCR